MEDEEWVKKILIGGLILLIPIIGTLAVYGYMLETARNVSRGDPRPLPDWTDFGDKLMKGLYALIIQIVYALPVIILQCIAQFATIGLSSQSEEAATAGGLIALCLMPVILVLSIVIGFFIFAAYARYIQTDSLSSAFQFNEVLRMLRESFGDWAMLLLTAILAGIAASLGLIACGVGVLFTGFYANLVIGHALGQIIVKQRGGTGGSDIGNIPPTYGSPS
jgi:hypothetical protein